MATQNPIEQEGTYPLPEAQLDRFFFKILVGYPSADELTEVLTAPPTGARRRGRARCSSREAPAGADEAGARSAGRLAREGLRRAPGAGHASQDRDRRADRQPVPALRQQPARRADAAPGRQSPRADRRAASTSASRTSRPSPLPALRHRLILNFEAEAEGITTDHIIAPDSAGRAAGCAAVRSDVPKPES